MDLPKRKHPRLKNYDYSQNGCYFVTICVKEKKHLLGRVDVGRDAHIPPQIILSMTGKVAEKYILNIEKAYQNILIENYVIMPNHIHRLLMFDSSLCDDGGMRASRPTLSTVVRSFKTMVTKEIGYSVWQDSFYDRVIDSVKGYEEVWNYIEENPYKWTIGKGEDF